MSLLLDTAGSYTVHGKWCDTPLFTVLCTATGQFFLPTRPHAVPARLRLNVRLTNLAWSRFIGVARILSGGALSFAKKVDDLFLVVALTDRLNIPPNLSQSAKTVLKLTLAVAGSALRVLRGALTHFSCKIRPENFFSPPWVVQVHQLHPPGYAYGQVTKRVRLYRFKGRPLCFLWLSLSFFSFFDTQSRISETAERRPIKCITGLSLG